MTDDDLLAAAERVVRRRRMYRCEGGQVGAAILTDTGAVHVGVCIDAPCGIGFCAEHAAIGAMVTAGEARVIATVAVNDSGAILPPCGRCREFLALLDPENMAARVLLPEGRTTTLAALLPEAWSNAKERG